MAKCAVCNGHKTISTADMNLPCPKCQPVNMRAYRVRDFGRPVVKDERGRALCFADAGLNALAVQVSR